MTVALLASAAPSTTTHEPQNPKPQQPSPEPTISAAPLPPAATNFVVRPRGPEIQPPLPPSPPQPPSPNPKPETRDLSLSPPHIGLGFGVLGSGNVCLMFTMSHKVRNFPVSSMMFAIVHDFSISPLSALLVIVPRENYKFTRIPTEKEKEKEKASK